MAPTPLCISADQIQHVVQPLTLIVTGHRQIGHSANIISTAGLVPMYKTRPAPNWIYSKSSKVK